MTQNNTGILLTNIGTPDAPTPSAVRRYLKQFLSDKRIIELPRLIWQPILYGIILPFRAKKSAQFYQKIWTTEGSPLLIFSSRIAAALAKQLQMPVELGMRYGNPSIKQALESLRAKNIKKIIVLPLYPQYSATTTASTFDDVAATLNRWRLLPEMTMIQHYADNAHYIQALSASIKRTWQHRGQPQHLLFSFHGIPKRYTELGDPYAEHCRLTTALVAKELQLSATQWSMAFQSRLGRAEWLTPYTDKVLAALPQQGITDIQVICPGFAADCLETLEELAMRGKETFLNAGGKSFYYIPALNDHVDHINTLENILKKFN